MKPLAPHDLWPLAVYEGVRDQFRREVIAAKKDRRIGVGPFMTFVFENRLTVKFQTQEILRAERMSAPEQVADELEGFNSMLPGPGELSATLLVELTGEDAAVKAQLARLSGLGKHLWFELDGKRLAAVMEQGRDDGTKLAAVQYVRFPLGAGAEAALRAGRPAALVIDHPAYQHRAELTAGQRSSLAQDLRTEES